MKKYSEYKKYMQKTATLSSTSALLQWDQEVYMPPQGIDLRAKQLALLSTMVHEMSTNEALGEYLTNGSSMEELYSDQAMNIQRSLEDYEKQRRISSDLVERMSQAQSEAFHSWIAARKENDFQIFAPQLENIFNLSKEYAAQLGSSDDPYETLMDLYDTGIKLAEVDAIFDQLIPAIHDILHNMDRDRFNVNPPKGIYPTELQMKLGEEICHSLGMDFTAGRQDLSEHPFTISFHPKDVRITTRIDESSLDYMLWSTIHECGHALYEQGLPPEEFGLPLGQATSLSIHESQSRLFENNLGRSEDFIHTWYPRMQELFPEALKGYDADYYYRAINKVEPSLIRTESDELHYHFHIYIRYKIEKELMHEQLKVADVRERWNSLYKEHLGLDVPDDNHGILQDVHWSHASIGYFPTYTLGSLYAAQFMGSAFAQMPELNNQIKAGKYSGLLHWLRKHIHTYGRYMTSDELCIKATGKSLSISNFTRYSSTKYVSL